MVFDPNPDTIVEKLMSFTRSEFENGLQRLIGTPVRPDTSGAYDLSDAAGGYPVTCTFDPQPEAVLGGLMKLSRARVVLRLPGLPPGDRAEFVARFDRTFQRGGG